MRSSGRRCTNGLLVWASTLTARAAAVGATWGPEPEVAELAREEGWIHLPSGPLAELAP